MAQTRTHTHETEIREERTTAGRSPVQMFSGLVGLVFLVVGVLGFVPGVTENVGDMEFWGPDAQAELFGIFAVSIFHNLFHIAFGIAGLAMAGTRMSARTFLVFGGAIYLVLWAYGLAIDLDSDWNFIPVDTADNWLHFGLGLGMLALGSLTAGRTSHTETRRTVA